MNADTLRALLGELELDMERLQILEEKRRLVKAKIARIEPDEFDHIALACTISNLYGIMEDYFTRVAKRFENRIESQTWHRDLPRRMATRIPEIRPAVLTHDQTVAIDQLRTFRHLFRHVYQQDLDIERLQFADERVPAAIAAFHEAHASFSEKLHGMKISLDAED